MLTSFPAPSAWPPGPSALHRAHCEAHRAALGLLPQPASLVTWACPAGQLGRKGSSEPMGPRHAGAHCCSVALPHSHSNCDPVAFWKTSNLLNKAKGLDHLPSSLASPHLEYAAPSLSVSSRGPPWLSSRTCPTWAPHLGPSPEGLGLGFLGDLRRSGHQLLS